MPEWMRSVFSGGVSLERANAAGLVMIGVALLLNVFSGKIAAGRPGAREIVRALALLLGCAGALVAVYG